MLRKLVKFSLLFRKVWKRLLMNWLKPVFGSYGSNFVFDPYSDFYYSHVHVKDDVYIGPGARFNASVSHIYIGNKVMFGPDVTIMGGDHNSSVIGEFMIDIKEKKEEDDQDVHIEDDVWIGTGVIILKGVRIETGTIIAAGSVVTKSMPAYSICAGVPCKVIKPRFSSDELEKHVELLRKK